MSKKRLIKLMSKRQAEFKECPFKISNPEVTDHCCDPKSCMAWTEVHAATEREDHSGGQRLIQNWANGLGVKVWREGPSGSLGYWKMEDAGYCKKLWPTADILIASDYINYDYD